MENRIKGFYIENFKAFKKGRWFDFNNLTILTGANSSGKSTLFKAVSFFATAFKNSDFPEFSLSNTTDIGSLANHLLNDRSKIPVIKLGFSYQSDFFEDVVKVYYRILPYQNQNRAKVINAEVFIGKSRLLQIFESEFVETISGYKPVLADFDDPGVITLMVNLKTLRNLLPDRLHKDTALLFNYLDDQFGEEWILEAVNMDKIGDALKRIRFEDEIYMDLLTDFYANLYRTDEKIGMLTDEDIEAEKDYIALSDRLNYSILIEGFFKPLLDELSAANRFFYQKQVLHIDFKEEMLGRILKTSPIIEDLPELTEDDARSILDYSQKNKYDPLLKYEFKKEHYSKKLRIEKRCSSRVNYGSLFNFLGEQRNDLNEENGTNSFGGAFKSEREIVNFVGTSFSIFGISKGIKIDKPINSAAIIHLIDENKKTYQLADLGRGEAKLIEIILKIATQIFVKSDNTHKRPEKDVLQFIFHIEEPEAFLHPKWQSRLADFFIFLVSNYNLQLIVETHSVYLIQRLQLMVARKQVNPGFLSLLYFDKIKNDVVYREIGIRPDGMLKNEFGDGFYDESAWLSIDLLNAQNPN